MMQEDDVGRGRDHRNTDRVVNMRPNKGEIKMQDKDRVITFHVAIVATVLG